MTKVTVLIPVYNGARFISEALQSISNQTFRDFEILVVDDASTDDSAAILSSYPDPRLKVIRNSTNVGVARSLNRGIKSISSEYVVRMDADDIAKPNRISNQISFMDANLDIGISGTWVKHIGRYRGVLEKRPCGAAIVKAFMMLDNPLMHPTIIFRREALAAHQLLYDPYFERCEDFDLWERASQFFAIDNMSEPLLSFRVHGDSVTQKHTGDMWRKTHEVLRRGLKKIGVSPDDDQILFHQRISHGDSLSGLAEVKAAEDWFKYLKVANGNHRVHPERSMHDALSFVWFRLCRNSSHLGVSLWKTFNESVFADRSLVNSKQRIAIALAMLFHTVRKCK